MSDKQAAAGMAMPGWLDKLGGFVERTRGFWRRLGEIETSAHRDALERIAIDRPVYIAGVARSGSTILLEMLARHPEVATHQYRDFPLLFAPVYWDRAFGRKQANRTEPEERAHKDRIKVTPASPEAMEEVLWMAFFENIHDPTRNQVLDASTSAPAFESFYRDHLKKMLMIRGGRRYLAKGNYNTTRLGYLLKLFPDARFIVPVREPRWHVASLLKQHRLFSAAERADPRILRHMRRVGHFEFGLDRRVVNAGDDEEAARIDALWSSGRDLEGYARLWSSLYGFVLDSIAADPAIARATLVVRYEDVCQDPQTKLAEIAAHAELAFPEEVVAAMAGEVSSPAYYDPGFTAAEEATIRELAGATARRLG
ncbi:MAG: sulfotransferase [Geminicoccaceae bacterium]